MPDWFESKKEGAHNPSFRSEDGECQRSHPGIWMDTGRMSHSGQQREKEVGETTAHSLNSKKFGPAGGKVCIEDKERQEMEL